MTGMRVPCVLLSLLVFACFPWTGWSAATQTVPESGSIITGSEGDKNITLFCEVFDDEGNQDLTSWSLQKLGEMSDGITTDDPNFAFDGEPVPTFPNVTFGTNLTILTLTEDLDRAIIFCEAIGVDEEAFNFTIRIYRPPILRDIAMQQIIVCEGDNGEVDLTAAGAEEAFPFPQEFNWTRDGVAVDNTTDGGRVTYGYPSVTFSPFNRDDSGQYVLSAANYRADGVLIGSDMASFTLDVQRQEFNTAFEPSDIIANEGENAIMTCKIASCGTPQIEMRAVGRTFIDIPDNDPRLVTEFMEIPVVTVYPNRLMTEFMETMEAGMNYRTRFIILDVDRMEDGTEFRCRYGSTIVSNIGTLDVRFAPQYTEDPDDQVVQEGNDFSLSIPLVPGDPEEDAFQWQFDGNNISSDTRIALTRDSIMITDVQRSDDGTYSVTTYNTVGATTVEFDLDVQQQSGGGVTVVLLTSLLTAMLMMFLALAF